MHHLSQYIDSAPNLNTLNRLGNQSDPSAANQNRAPESSANQNRLLRHPRALGYGGGPFSALGSSRPAIAYLNTCGPPPPSHDQLTLLNTNF